MPGHSGSGKFRAIPGKPSAETLSHAAFPDLVVAGITFASKGKGRIETTVTIKNEGKAKSKATTASALLTRGDRSRDKHSWSVQALKAGARKELTWTFSVKPGHNTLEVSVNDANRHGNRLEKGYFLLAKPAQALANPGGEVAEGARRGSKAQASKGRGRLVVQKVIFDDFRGRKPDKTWVAITLKNIGEKVTPAREFKVQVHRADGTRKRNIFRVRALKPGETDRIEGFFQMARGYNTLRIKGIGGASFHNFAAFTPKERFFTKTHYFNPPKVKFNAGQATLAKNAARVSKAQPSGEMTPNSNVLENLSKAKPIHIHKPVKIATYDAQVGTFTHPQQNEIIAPNKPYTIAWTMPDPGPDARLWLYLSCIEGPPNMPDLIIARGMDPSIRSYTWNVANLPTGRYHLELRIVKKWGTHAFLISFYIDHVRLHVKQETASPKPRYIGKSVTVRGLITNTGCDALEPMWHKVAIHGPGGFYAEKRFSAATMLHDGPGFPCGITFTPPFYGIYRAVFEPDANHHYPLATQDLSKSEKTFIFGVSPLPDLLATVNKVGDHASVGTSHFHIRVKNIGVTDAPETTAEFYIWTANVFDDVHSIYNIPRLAPGEVWTHDYNKRWQGATGREEYLVIVDPHDHIHEMREDNNRIADTLQVYAAGSAHSTSSTHGPDARLVVTGVMGLDHLIAGRNVSFTVRFQNQTSTRAILPPVSVRIHPFIFESGVNSFDVPELYPGETFDLVLDGKITNAGTFQFKVVTPVYKQGHFLPDTGQVAYKKTIIVAKNTEIPRGAIETLAGKKPLPPTGKPITILSPDKNKIWAVGKTYQIAWAGQVAGPFTVTLIPKDHPDAPIQIVDNTTQCSLDYTIGSNLTSGAYRVKVQGTDGRGISDLFSITSDTKPNLKLKTVSISNALSGDCQKPYQIRIQTIIENTGAYQSKPFRLQFIVLEGKKKIAFDSKLLAPMLDQRTLYKEFTCKVQITALGVHVAIDPSNVIDESNENDNYYRGRMLYHVSPYSDLRVTCRQEGSGLVFTIKNSGDHKSPRTSLVFKYKPKYIILSKNYSPWHKEGHYLVTPPIPVGALDVGNITSRSIKGSELPVPIHGGELYIATIDPKRTIKELCYKNNTVAGILSSPSASNAATNNNWLKTSFGVTDLTKKIYSGGRPTGLFWAGLQFKFLIWNKSNSSSFVTPTVRAILALEQGTQEKTFTYDIPTLFPGSISLRRDEYSIDQVVYFRVSRGDVTTYHLWLKKGNEMVLLASGKVTVGN